VLPMTVRSLRPARADIDTWSSVFDDDGIESTDAGCASTLFSDTTLAAVYWAIM